MSNRAKQSGEFELIAKYFAPLARDPGAFGLKDDAAIYRPRAGHEIVLTTDAIVEGVHFLQSDPPDTLARKALRVNLSDLAAKGAVPKNYLLSIAFPSWVTEDWIARFAKGLGDDQTTFGMTLLGGDTDRTPGPLVISVTAIGEIEQGKIVRREGAHPGDIVFVSGEIGLGGAGLEVLQDKSSKLSPNLREAALARYRTPDPRLSLGRALVGVVSAGIDVSDGLIADLGHIAECSHVRIMVQANRIPLAEACRALWGDSDRTIAHAATAGDDYELAFTVPPQNRDRVEAAAIDTDIRVTEIGRVEAGEGVMLVDAKGIPIPLDKAGFTHF